MDLFKKITNKILYFIKSYRSLFIISLIALLCVELLNHPTFNLFDLVNWIFHHKRVMVMNYIIYCNICILIYLVMNRLNWSNIIFITTLVVVGICNYYKLLMKGENVVLWDVLNLQAAVGIMGELHIEIGWQVILCVIVLIAVLYHQFRGARKQQRISVRFKYFAATFIILSSLTVGIIFNNGALASLKIFNMDWNQDKNYRENGFILSFFMNLKNISVITPEEYSETNIQDIISRIERIEDYTAVEVEKKPNIIAVMSESFADISKANEGLTFKEPLTPFIDSLEDNVIKGDLLVSIFGGGTANSEFEYLMGHSMKHLPIGSVAFDRYIETTQDSMVSILKQEGYIAKAVHPYLGTFWNRDVVYDYLGFDDFYTMDDFSEESEKIKGYISDKEVYNKITSLYENKESEQPLFTFAVTMENHTPYTDTSNGVVEVEGDETLFKETSKIEAGVHAKGVQDADKMYQMLVEYFSQVNEPTIIVMFGDHHPFVSSTINLDSNHLDDVNKYKTPYVMWANYDVEEKIDYTMGGSFLGAYTLLNAGIDLPNYFKYNYYASTLMSGYNNYFVLSNEDEFYKYSEKLPEDIDQFIKDHELLQYDLLFGNGYAKDYLWKE